MKFLAFLFALVALYALAQAKGDVPQRKESPLRKALRTTQTSAPVQEPVEVVRRVPSKTVQRQRAVVIQEPVQPVQEQEPVDADQPAEEEVLPQQPAQVDEQPVQKQRPVQVQQPVQQEQPAEEPVKQRRPVPVPRKRPVQVQEPVQQEQPAEEPVKQQRPVPVPRKRPNLRVTQAPLVIQRPVERTNVEIIRPWTGTVRAQRPVVIQEPVQEQVEQGQDETDEDAHGVQAQEPEPVPAKRVIQQPSKLDAPDQKKRRFNVLLRTAEGFNEKAGYSVHSRNALVN